MRTIELVVDTVEDTHNLEKVESVLHSVVAAKQYGHENVLSKVISEACVNSLTKTASGRTDLDVDNVRVVKINGSSVDNTSYMQGMILRNAVVGSVKHVENAKVWVLTILFLWHRSVCWPVAWRLLLVRPREPFSFIMLMS